MVKGFNMLKKITIVVLSTMLFGIPGLITSIIVFLVADILIFYLLNDLINKRK